MTNSFDFELGQEDNFTNEPQEPRAEVVDINNINIDELTYTALNVLGTSIYTMSKLERKVLALAQGHVQFKHDRFYYYRIPVKLIEQVLGLNPADSYRDIDQITTKLMTRVLVFDTGKSAKGKQKSKKKITWVTYCDYITAEDSETGQASVGIQINSLLMPMLLNLQRNFGSIPVSMLLAMPSIHSLRIFEILHFSAFYDARDKRFFKPKIEMSVLDLKVKLGIEENYDNFAYFRRSVLEPAQRDCAENTHLVFTWKETKGAHGKIVKLTFNVEYNKNYRDDQLLLLSDNAQNQLPAAIRKKQSPASNFKPVFDNHLAAFSSYEKRKTLEIIKPVPDADKQAIIDEFNDALNPNKTKPVEQRWRYLRELVGRYEQGKFTSTSELSITREKKQREAEQARRRAEQEREKEKIKQLKEQFYEARHEKALEIWADWSGEEQEQFLMLDNYVADRYRKDGVKSMMVLSMLAEYMAKNGDFPADLKSFKAWQEATDTAALTPA